MAHLLIVDDDRDGREALCRFLQRSGHEVICVDHGRDALAAILSRTEPAPDLILLDLAMPEMDGVDFLQVLRSYLRLHDLKVILLTAYSNSPRVERAAALGVRTVLPKANTSLEQIRETVEHELAA